MSALKRKRLDRNKSVGTVTPPFMQATNYQDGVFFDSRGLELFTDADDTDEKRQASLDKWGEREAQAAKARAAIANKAAVSDGEADEADPEVDDLEDEDGEGKDTEPSGPVNLRLWALGEEKHPWFSVREAMEKQLHIKVKNKPNAIEKLIEKGVITAKEVPA